MGVVCNRQTRSWTFPWQERVGGEEAGAATQLLPQLQGAVLLCTVSRFSGETVLVFDTSAEAP